MELTDFKRLEDEKLEKIYIDDKLRIIDFTSSVKINIFRGEYINSIFTQIENMHFDHDDIIENINTNFITEEEEILEFTSVDNKYKIIAKYYFKDVKFLTLEIKEKYFMQDEFSDDKRYRDRILMDNIMLRSKLLVNEKLKKNYKSGIEKMNFIMNGINEAHILYNKNGEVVFYNRNLTDFLEWRDVNMLTDYKMYDSSIKTNIPRFIVYSLRESKELKDYIFQQEFRGEVVNIRANVRIFYEDNGSIGKKLLTIEKLDYKEDTSQPVASKVFEKLNLPALIIRFISESNLNKGPTNILMSKIYEENGLEIVGVNNEMSKLYENNKDGIDKLAQVIIDECIRCKSSNGSTTLVDNEILEAMGKKLNCYSIHSEDAQIKSVSCYFIDRSEADGKLDKGKKENKRGVFEDKEVLPMLSHDLRAPITVICSSIQLLNNVYHGEISSGVKNVIKNVDVSSKQLLKLVNNILDISKLKSGFMELNLETVDIVDLVENITQSIIPFADIQSVNIIFDTNIEEEFVLIDKDKLERVVLNLLSNAIKFSKAESTVFITLNVDIEENNILIKVKDTGIGIPKDKIKSVFNKYTQGNKCKNSGEGTGLGLVIVKDFIELMDGSVEVKSQENNGTTFYVSIPYQKTDEKSDIKQENFDEDINRKINIELSDINK